MEYLFHQFSLFEEGNFCTFLHTFETLYFFFEISFMYTTNIRTNNIISSPTT